MNTTPYLKNSLPGRAGWPVALAHRGADVRRENTVGAVRQAVAQGFGYIEIDVRTSADGQVVVFHDEYLERVTTGKGKLSDHPWQHLATLRIVGAHATEYDDGTTLDNEPMVLLEHLLEAFPTTYFNVDLKDKASAKPMVEVLRRHQAWDRVLIASFHDSHRAAFFNHLRPDEPQVASSVGITTVAILLLAYWLKIFGPAVRWLQKRLPLHALQIPVGYGPLKVVTKGFVAACHAHNIAVHVWVINEPTEMRRLLQLGVNGIVTDDGAAVAQVLQEAGQWPQHEGEPEE